MESAIQTARIETRFLSSPPAGRNGPHAPAPAHGMGAEGLCQLPGIPESHLGPADKVNTLGKAGGRIWQKGSGPLTPWTGHIRPCQDCSEATVIWGTWNSRHNTYTCVFPSSQARGEAGKIISVISQVRKRTAGEVKRPIQATQP